MEEAGFFQAIFISKQLHSNNLTSYQALGLLVLKPLGE